VVRREPWKYRNQSGREVTGREAAILGLILFAATDAELGEIHAAIVAGLENGTLRPIVGHELPMM
jgi:NADPH2:quinone reductase